MSKKPIDDVIEDVCNFIKLAHSQFISTENVGSIELNTFIDAYKNVHDEISYYYILTIQQKVLYYSIMLELHIMLRRVILDKKNIQFTLKLSEINLIIDNFSEILNSLGYKIFYDQHNISYETTKPLELYVKKFEEQNFS